MLGRKTFAPKLFDAFSLEEQVSADPLLRRVTAAVDFSFVRGLTARFYSHTGQPGIDPVVLFKLSLLGCLCSAVSTASPANGDWPAKPGCTFQGLGYQDRRQLLAAQARARENRLGLWPQLTCGGVS